MKKIVTLALALILTLSLALPVLAENALDPEDWLCADPYYWHQLSDAHKDAYDAVISNALSYPRQKPAVQRDRRYQALASMIVTENPRLFWIDWVDSFARLRFDTTAETSYDGMILPEGETLASLQQQFLAGIDDAVAQIRRDLPAKANAKAKAKAVHDWLCRSNTYNDAQTSSHKKEHSLVTFSYLAAHSAYSAVIPGDAYEPVCEGYAGAFKILCEELGVRCIIVNGSMKGVSYHSWNMVQTENGSWYLVDVTADDGTGKKFGHTCFMGGASLIKKYKYTARPYMNSGVNPDNGYTEGAAFTIPQAAR